MAEPERLTIGPMHPSDPARTLAKAAEKLGVPVPPNSRRARLDRVAKAIYRAHHEGPWKLANQGLFRSYARAAIAEMNP